MRETPETPLAERYEETPEVPPTERDEFDPADEWVNYWDVNPVGHGGTFIKWDGDAWDIVEVTPPSAWPEGAYIVEKLRVYPDNVWEDPSDPMTEFTDDMESILSSLHDAELLPNAPPFLDRVAYYVADFTHYLRGDRQDTFEVPEGDVQAYWDEVSKYGVDPENVESVADDNLPESED